MTTNILNKITMIIPTHNREKYLVRILDFYEPFPLNIIIVDSSDIKFNIEKYTKPNIRYFYNTKGKAADKWFRALNYVKTEYVVYCADDDFIFIDSLIESLKFLINNPDYSTAQGRQLFFRYFCANKEVEYDALQEAKNLIPNITKINNNDNNIKIRLDNFCLPYRNPLYGVFRLSTIKEIYDKIKDYQIYEGFASEVCVSALTTIYGKVIELDNIYNLMEYIPNSCAKVLKDIPTLVKENHIDLINSKKLIKNTLIEKGFKEYDANLYTENLFSNLLNFIKEMKKHHRQKEIIYCNSNKNNRNAIEEININKLYNKQPYLKMIENKIIEHSINSGFLYNCNNKNLKLSQDINLFITKIDNIIHQIVGHNSKIVLYGAGNISKIINLMHYNSISYIVDKNKELHDTLTVNNKPIYNINKLNQLLTYDFILITVLGREEEIISDLINNYKIDNKIILHV